MEERADRKGKGQATMAKKGEASVGSGKTENQKLKTYLILQILQQKTDEDYLLDSLIDHSWANNATIKVRI